MTIKNPKLNALYKNVCEQLQAKETKQSEVKTELSQKKELTKFRYNELEPDKASTIQDRVKLKFQLMNKQPIPYLE